MKSLGLLQEEHSLGINGEGRSMGLLANPGSPGKMAVEREHVSKVCHW